MTSYDPLNPKVISPLTSSTTAFPGQKGGPAPLASQRSWLVNAGGGGMGGGVGFTGPWPQTGTQRFLGKIGEPEGTLGKIRGITTPPPLRILLILWGAMRHPQISMIQAEKNKQTMSNCLGYLGYSGDSDFRMIVLAETDIALKNVTTKVFQRWTVSLGEGKVKTKSLDYPKYNLLSFQGLGYVVNS